VELRIEGVERVHEIGGHTARPGHEFVIVDTSWKNVIPLQLIDKTASQSPTAGFGLGAKKQAPDPANQTLEPTAYVVPMLRKQMWLLSDGRFADTVDLDVLPSVPDHLSKEGFSLPKLDDVVRGKVIFEAPVDVAYQAFQFYDNDNGHALIPLKGTPPSSPSPTVGPMRHNEILQLAVTEADAGPSGIVAPPGMRAFVVGLRGTSRSPKDIVDIPFLQFVYAQNEQGCVVRPEAAPTGLARAFEEIGSFPPTGANEGQLLFFVPAESKALRVLLRSAKGAPIDLPAPADFKPSWPTPTQTIADGTTLRVHLLPTPAWPTGSPGPDPARRLVDVVVENLNPSKGVELQSVQLRLVKQDGSFVEPSPSSADLPCRLIPDIVIPPATARRFALIYDVGPDEKVRMNYRGFELDETTVDAP
jgi:hypothetical protein